MSRSGLPCTRQAHAGQPAAGYPPDLQVLSRGARSSIAWNNLGHDPVHPWLGILMLDTRFPRLPGDVGHASTWRMPVRLQVVHGASPQRVVRMGDRALLQPFIDAARTLEAGGAQAITTSCGFLVRWQAELQAALRVPVWTSSLLLLPELAAVSAVETVDMVGTVAHAGVLTVDADSLGAAELAAAGAPPDTPVQGLAPGCHLQSALLDNRPDLDSAVAEADAVQAARELVRRHGGIRRIVLECTNLPPYADAIVRATGREVHHLPAMVHARWAALHAGRCAP